MAVVLTEREVSRGGTPGQNGRRSMLYLAKGSNDYDEVLAAVEGDGGAPLALGSLKRSRPEIRPLSMNGASGTWEVEVPYLPMGSIEKAYGFQYLRGRTLGASEHRKFSIRTRRRYVPPAYNDDGTFASEQPAATNHHCAIGVRGQSAQITVDGVEVPSRAQTFEIGWLFENSDVDAAYLRTVYTLTSGYNNATWWDYAAGEVTFLGADYNRNLSGDWEFCFSFKAEPNQIATIDGSVGSGPLHNKEPWSCNVDAYKTSPPGGYGPVGDPDGVSIRGITKLGTDYVWAEFETSSDPDSHGLSAGIRQVNVEQMLPAVDFSQLRLGTTFSY